MASNKRETEKQKISDGQQNKQNFVTSEKAETTTHRSYDQFKTHFPKNNVTTLTSDRKLNVFRVPERDYKSFNAAKNLQKEGKISENPFGNFGASTFTSVGLSPVNIFPVRNLGQPFPFNQQVSPVSSAALEYYDSVVDFKSEPTFSRPFWPFQRWRSSHFLKKEPGKACFEFPKELKNACSPVLPLIFDIEVRNIRETPFGLFINSLCKEATVIDSEESKQIQTMVEKIMIDTFDDLSRRYKMFRNCSLLKMGSTYEETKVGIPDEFDFMIEIPELQDQSVLEFVDDDYWKYFNIRKENFSYQDTEIRDIKIKDRKYFEDILESSDGEDDKGFVRSLWHKIHNQVADSMKSVLPKGWTWLDLTPGFNTLALTQSLLWEGREFSKLVINLDICLSVPINTEGSTGIETQPQKHSIIRSNGTSRYTYAVKEIGIWKKFAREDGRKVAYRIIKVILSSCLPKTYNDNLFRLDSLVPSYWVKTIMFYLFECYQDESNWSKEEIPLRILEVVFLLEKCLDSRELSSYFVPHNILKGFAWEDKLEEFHTILQNITDLNKLLLESCLEEKETLVKLTELRCMLKIKNEKCLEEGLFNSLILICYLYAYNEFEESTMEKIRLFVSLFLKDTLELREEGKELEIYFREIKVYINKLIYEQFDDDTQYFNE